MFMIPKQILGCKQDNSLILVERSSPAAQKGQAVQARLEQQISGPFKGKPQVPHGRQNKAAGSWGRSSFYPHSLKNKKVDTEKKNKQYKQVLHVLRTMNPPNCPHPDPQIL